MKVGVPQPDGSLRLNEQIRPTFIQDLFRHTSGLAYGGRPDSNAVGKLYPNGTQPALERRYGRVHRPRHHRSHCGLPVGSWCCAVALGTVQIDVLAQHVRQARTGGGARARRLAG